MAGSGMLQGRRVTLRPVERTDVDFLQRHRNDPRVWRTLQRTAPAALADRDAWFQRLREDDATHRVVAADDEAVGYVKLSPLTDAWGIAAITYWIVPDAQGRGYGTTAAKQLVEYAFEQRNFTKVLGYVFEGNVASMRVLESIGFELEDVHRREVYVDGEYRDLHAYGLLADEWHT